MRPQNHPLPPRTAYARVSRTWFLWQNRWTEQREKQELRAQSALIHLDARLSATVLTLWTFTATALNVGTWQTLQPLVCILVILLGTLAITLLILHAGGETILRITGQTVLISAVITAQAVLLCATGVDSSRATLKQAQGHSIRLSGTVESLRPVDQRTTLTVIRLEQLQGRSVRAAVNEQIRVYTRRTPEGNKGTKSTPTTTSRTLQPGTKVTAIGTLELGDGPFNAHARLRGTIFTHPKDQTMSTPAPTDPQHNALPPNTETPRPSTLQDLKSQLSSHAAQILGHDSAAIVLGTAYGDDSLMSRTVREEYKLSGLSHITAVSGANIAIIFLIAYRLLLGIRPYRITSLYLHLHPQKTKKQPGKIPPIIRKLSLLSIPHRAMVLTGISAVLAYATLLEHEGSVIRSLTMGLLGALTMLRGSGRHSLAALQVTVLICLLAAPYLTLDAGFTLSVTATASLILLGPPLTRLLTRYIPTNLAQIIATPIAASLWCTPIILSISGTIPLYTVPANIAAAPLTPISMLAGLAALGFFTLGVTPLADTCLRIGGIAATGIEHIASLAAHAPGNPWEPGTTLPAITSIAIILTLSTLIWWADTHRYRTITNRRYLRTASTPITTTTNPRKEQPPKKL